MSYYIGFRFGWARLGKRVLFWHDPQYYPNWPKGRRIGAYVVSVK